MPIPTHRAMKAYTVAIRSFLFVVFLILPAAADAQQGAADTPEGRKRAIGSVTDSILRLMSTRFSFVEATVLLIEHPALAEAVGAPTDLEWLPRGVRSVNSAEHLGSLNLWVQCWLHRRQAKLQCPETRSALLTRPSLKRLANGDYSFSGFLWLPYPAEVLSGAKPANDFRESPFSAVTALVRYKDGAWTIVGFDVIASG